MDAPSAPSGRQRIRPSASLTTVLLLALFVSSAPAAQRDSIPWLVLLGRAADYVKEFERQMTNVVSDESYVQEVIRPQAVAESGLTQRQEYREVDLPFRRRELKSDFLVVRLGPEELPVPFRDVYEVDGRPVRDRTDRLTRLFLQPTANTLEQAWRVADESARYNIGNVRRTVNVPVLPLVVLRTAMQPRFRFTDRGETSEDGVRVRIVAYEETRTPTIIRGSEGHELPARGRLWIAPATGQVTRAELETSDKWVRATIAVRYKFDDAVNAAVPVEMREAYGISTAASASPVPAGKRDAAPLSQQQRVNGVASYSRFRRFSVDVSATVDTDRLRPVVDRSGIELMQIPAGHFEMGSPGSEPGRNADEVLHSVTISRAFLLGRTEVTQEQWRQIMGTNPSHFAGCGPKCPVENVTFAEVLEFLDHLTHLSSSYSYRLPTEAEWEYACRAGTPTSVVTGTNAWGLDNMTDNVWEWTSDWYAPYPAGPATDPNGAANGHMRVIRGGRADSDANATRCPQRSAQAPQDRGFTLGFRVAAEPKR
jgi:formylglycine-generating enzyme required for sulfatase activity